MKYLMIGAVTLLAASAAGMAASAQPAPAADAKPGPHLLKLTNSGKNGITAVFVAKAGSPDASDDLLGKQTASSGKTVMLKVADPKGDCVFDIQFLMNDGRLITRKAVDLCQTSELSVGP